jgi:purine-binding chemotaxis protein CheW
MATELQETIGETGRKLAGKYLTFVLGQESYGIPVLTIREIIRMTDITSVPQMPDYIKGVINLRGKVIPIVDLRLKFRLARVESTERTCIIVVQVSTPSGAHVLMGLIVDAVEEVLNVAAGDIERAPDFGARLEADYIVGMAKIRGTVKTLLDINCVITSDALSTPGATAQMG